MQTRASRDPYAMGLELSAANRHFEAIECFEEALARRPQDTRVLFALGNTATALGMARPAESFFRQVLALEPHRAEALVNLANLLRSQGEFAAAEALLIPALARNAGVPELWLTLGSVFREMGYNDRAASHYREALKLRPDYSLALGNLADILADEGKLEDAVALYDHVIRSDPQNAQARLNRAVLHLVMGNLSEGWRDYASRSDIPGKVPIADRRIPNWTGGTLEDVRLLVRVEQGVGDQIMFAGLIPDLVARAEREEGSVLLECDPRLVTLFARSFPGIKVRGSQIESRGGVLTAGYDWLKSEGGANATILLGSLPEILRSQLAQFPKPHRYLKADEAETAHWRDAFRSTGRGPRIGVCWRSGARGGGRAIQYAPLIAWANFLRAVPGTLVAAQYDAMPEELYELEKLSGRKLVLPRDLDQKNELDKTAAMFAALDAVVSAPTAVSWISAGLGVPTFKILYDRTWTSFGAAYEPFAPSAELIVPKSPGDWTDTFSQAMQRINALRVSI